MSHAHILGHATITLALASQQKDGAAPHADVQEIVRVYLDLSFWTLISLPRLSTPSRLFVLWLMRY